jgi:hypothetical protein
MHHRMILRGKIIIISDASFGLQEKLFYNLIWNKWYSLGGNNRHRCMGQFKFQIPNQAPNSKPNSKIQNPQIHHSTTSPLHHSPPSPQTPKEFNVNSPGIYPVVEGENARISPPQMVIVYCIKNSMGGDQGEGRGGIHVTLYVVRFSFFISWNNSNSNSKIQIPNSKQIPKIKIQNPPILQSATSPHHHSTTPTVPAVQNVGC